MFSCKVCLRVCFLLLSSISIVLNTTTHSEADLVIQPMSAVSSIGSDSIDDVRDQSGLSTPYVDGVTDAASYSSTHKSRFHESCFCGNPVGTVSFDLGGEFELSENSVLERCVSHG